MQHLKLLFIGGGNMTRAMVLGLLKAEYPREQIMVLDHHQEKCAEFKQKFGVWAETSIQKEMLDAAEVIIFAVKPQGAKVAVETIALNLGAQQPLIISVMTGISCARLQGWLQKDLAIVRAMPNTPALVQAGATGLYANSLTSALQKNLAESIFRAVGIIAWLEQEALISAVTALSGSGPAYFFEFMHLMKEAGVKLGLNQDVAELLAIQTAFGAAKLALELPQDLQTLQKQVTAKGGTTEAALASFAEAQLDQIIAKAMQAAVKRSEELALA